MSDKKVEYELSLKDALTPKIKSAEEAVTHFEGKMDTMKEKIHGIGKGIGEVFVAIGISFLAFKGFEIIEQGEEKVHKLHEAEAQLSNTMQNMGTYSEEAFEKMVDGAGKMAQGIKFTKEEILGLQSHLKLLGNVGDEEINRITTTAANMSSKFGMSMTEAGDMLAKSLNNPEMARRLGSKLLIDKSVMAHIKELAKEGQNTEARMLLLSAAEDRVKNSAKDAFNVDPLAVYNKQMESMKVALGTAAIEVQKFLAPALEWLGRVVKSVADGVANLIGWVKENKKLITEVTIVIGLAASAWGIYLLVTNASIIATTIMTAAQAALNFVLDANPIGIVIIAIAGFVAGIMIAWEKCVGFRAVLTGLWGVVKEFGNIVSDVFQGVWKQVHGVFTFNASEIKAGFGQATSAMAEAGQRMATAYKKGYDGVMEEDARKKAEIAKPAMAGAKVAPKLGAPPPDKPGKDTSPKGATGTKSTTINIHIGKLIEQFKISTTNLTETSHKIKEAVAQAMTGAIADSQIVAGI
jgi:hypothetical protein